MKRECRRNRRLRCESLEERTLLAVFCVDSLADGAVDLTDGATTLREALYSASRRLGADTIEFAAALFSEGTTSRLVLSEGELVLDSDATISVPEGCSLELVAADGMRALRVDSGVSATLANLTVVGGSLENGNGGAILSEGGTLTLTDVRVQAGAAAYGGGIAVSGGALIATGLVVQDCVASYGGGGVWLGTGASFVGTNATIENNEAGWYGGGLYLQGGEARLTSSAISGNTAAYDGGGVANYNGELALTASFIDGNLAVRGGGGVNYGTLTALGCAIVSNRAYSETNVPGRTPCGGGALNFGTLVLGESTVASNSAFGVGASGGGLLLSSGSATVANSIVAENASLRDGDVAVDANAELVARRLLTSWAGNADSTDVFAYDPARALFADPASGDWRLAVDSQAIDRGSDDLAQADGFGTNSVDLSGRARYFGDAIDLGAYEFSVAADLATSLERESYSVQEGCCVYISVASELPEDVVCFWDYGLGVFEEGPASAWIDVSRLGLIGGVEYTVRVYLQDSQGNVGETASATLTVQSVAPSIAVSSTLLNDDLFLVARCEFYAPSGSPAAIWQFNWGDGTTTTYESLSYALTAAHAYSTPVSEERPTITVQTTDVYGRTFRSPYYLDDVDFERDDTPPTPGPGDDVSYSLLVPSSALDETFAELARPPIPYSDAALQNGDSIEASEAQERDAAVALQSVEPRKTPIRSRRVRDEVFASFRENEFELFPEDEAFPSPFDAFGSGETFFSED